MQGRKLVIAICVESNNINGAWKALARIFFLTALLPHLMSIILRILLFLAILQPSLAEQPSKETPPEGMVFIPGGTYKRGEERKISTRSTYLEEQPAHEVTISAFFLDKTEVTNAQFKKFVDATGYQTQAERGFSREDFPNAPADQLVGGALIFTPPTHEVQPFSPGAANLWWIFTPGANWQHPQGPDSNLEGLMDHPVVCLTHEDALAYCKWAGKRLPTEAEWERAARGGLDEAIFAWGDKPKPDPDSWPANVYQGKFPNKDSALDGYASTAPVKSFSPNGYGLYDISGNVWEYTADIYRPDYYQKFSKNPSPNPTGPPLSQALAQPHLAPFFRGSPLQDSYDLYHPLTKLWVVKGGSFLCHHTYCLRYRPAARHYAESLSPTNHTGFRCARNLLEK